MGGDGAIHRYGTRFSKVPTLFGRISGDIVVSVSSKPRCLKARNFALILIFIAFATYEKPNFTEAQLYRISGSQFYEWLFGPEESSGLPRNGPQFMSFGSSREKKYEMHKYLCHFIRNFLQMLH